MCINKLQIMFTYMTRSNKGDKFLINHLHYPILKTAVKETFVCYIPGHLEELTRCTILNEADKYLCYDLD